MMEFDRTDDRGFHFRYGFLTCDAMLVRYALSSCVCLSQVSELLKRLNIGSRNQRHKIAQGL